jgi:hypothetical protein
LAEDILGNQSALIVFRVDAATDARELVPRLDGQVEAIDIGNLPRQWCYLKVSERGLRVPAFSLAVASTPPPDPALAEDLRAASRRRHARQVAEVDGIIRAQWAWFGALAEGGLHQQVGAAIAALAAADPAADDDAEGPAATTEAPGASAPATVAEAMAAAGHRRRRRGGRTARREPAGDQATRPGADPPDGEERGAAGV